MDRKLYGGEELRQAAMTAMRESGLENVEDLTHGGYAHRYRGTFTNKRGERVLMEISGWDHDRAIKRDTMNLWLKAGYMKEFIACSLSCRTYVTFDNNGYEECREWYNPTIKLAENKKRMVMDFEWVLPFSAENIKKLIAEVMRRSENQERM